MIRMSLKQLAKSRGYTSGGVVRDTWQPCWFGSAYAHDDTDEIAIEAPTRRAAEAGLRAALEALPEKARKK